MYDIVLYNTAVDMLEKTRQLSTFGLWSRVDSILSVVDTVTLQWCSGVQAAPFRGWLKREVSNVCWKAFLVKDWPRNLNRKFFENLECIHEPEPNWNRKHASLLQNGNPLQSVPGTLIVREEYIGMKITA